MWADSTLKLFIGGLIALLSIAVAGAVAIAGILAHLSTEAIIAMLGPFATITGMAAAFFFGHQNGYKNGVKDTKNGGVP